MRNQAQQKNVYNFLDVNISDLIIENPLELKSNNLKGCMYVYLYRPYVYTGSALNCK
jgi:hypothetical protein